MKKPVAQKGKGIVASLQKAQKVIIFSFVLINNELQFTGDAKLEIL